MANITGLRAYYLPLQYPHLTITRTIEGFVNWLFSSQCRPTAPIQPKKIVSGTYEKWVSFLRTIYNAQIYGLALNNQFDVNELLAKSGYDLYFQKAPIVATQIQFPQLTVNDYFPRYYNFNQLFGGDLYLQSILQLPTVFELNGYVRIVTALTRYNLNFELIVTAQSTNQLLDVQSWLFEVFGQIQKYRTLNSAGILIPLTVPVEFVEQYLKPAIASALFDTTDLSGLNSEQLAQIEQSLYLTSLLNEQQISTLLTDDSRSYINQTIYYFVYPILNAYIRLNDVSDQSVYLAGVDLNQYMLSASFELQVTLPHGLWLIIEPKFRYILLSLQSDNNGEIVEADAEINDTELEDVIALKLREQFTQTNSTYNKQIEFLVITNIQQFADIVKQKVIDSAIIEDKDELANLISSDLSAHTYSSVLTAWLNIDNPDFVNKQIGIRLSRNIIHPTIWQYLEALNDYQLLDQVFVVEKIDSEADIDLVRAELTDTELQILLKVNQIGRVAIMLVV